uniref:Uncharacterized protein n=1 Tax=Eptatretus burgeri TaxID=7764 RepID=A0A8C4Q5G3_EPTBU
MVCVFGDSDRPSWNRPLPTCVAPCGGKSTGSTGAVLSPGFPGNYSGAQHCAFSVGVPHGFVIFAEFSFFQTAHKDFLYIYDGPSQRAPLLGSLSGSLREKVLPLTSSHQMTLVFSPSKDSSAKGFHLVYKAVPKSSASECTPITAPRHGQKIGSGLAVGTTLGFQCDPGYKLKGAKSVRCITMANALARWNDSMPSCSVPCGGNLTDMSGTILSPGFPGSYANNLSCVWRITLPEGDGVQLQVLKFATEHTWDTLHVYDGQDEHALRLGSFSGTSVPTFVNSSSNELYIHFISDVSMGTGGFHLKYTAVGLSSCSEPNRLSNGIKIGDRYLVNDVVSFECESGFKLQGHAHIMCMPGPIRRWNFPPPICRAMCGGTLTGDAGVILSPDFPGTYPNLIDCFWDIRLSEGRGVVLRFENFTMEQNAGYLEVLARLTGKNVTMRRFSGSNTPETVLSTTHHTILHLHSDSSQEQQGFCIRYDAYELQNCPDPLPFPNGHVLGSGVGVGQSLVFRCQTGFALIGQPVLTCQHGVSRSWDHPFPQCIAPCGGNVTGMKGTVYSPGYPEEYPSFQDCTWLISVPHGHGIHINFTLLHTEPIYDFISIWDGPNQSSHQLGIFSGNSGLDAVSSLTHHVLMRFQSDFSIGGFFALTFFAYQLRKCTQPSPVANADVLLWDNNLKIGDMVTYRCRRGYTLIGSATLTCQLNTWLQMVPTPPTCTASCPSEELRTDSSGIILSPAYPANYPYLQTCSWIVVVEKDHNITFYVESFQSERQYDELEIFDGVNRDHPRLAGLSGDHTAPLSFATHGPEAFVYWKSDHATSKKGFRLHYSAGYCSLPGAPEHGSVLGPPKGSLGSVVRWTCEAGFRLVGKSTATCRSSSLGYLAWDARVPACQAVSCGVPRAPINGGIIMVNRSTEMVIKFTCNPGFRLLKPQQATAFCHRDRRWSHGDSPPICSVISCPDLGSFWLEHGGWRLLNGSGRDVGSCLVFYCLPGYYLSGPRISYCTASGTWSWDEERPKCTVISCNELPSIPNGRKIGTQVTFGATAIFQCDAGFTLVGTQVRECLASGLWSGKGAGCVGA